MDLFIIGTGCPDPRPERFGSAYVLDTGAERVCVDCGPGTTYKMARTGLRPSMIGALFLTHHHSDHNADVPAFILNWWDYDLDYENPLRIYGPEPTELFIDRLIGEDGAFRPDLESRIAHPASHWCHVKRGGVMPRRAPAFPTRNLGDGDTVDGDGWSARTVVGVHIEPTLVSLAVRIDAPDGSVVFAGDCVDSPSLRELAQGADTLVMACTHFDTLDPVVADCIPGVKGVCGVVNAGGVRRVVLTHMSPNFDDPKERRRAVSAVEAGVESGTEVLCPDELSVVSL